MTSQPPDYKSGSFTCPHCRAFTQQTWFYADHAKSENDDEIDPRVAVAECFVCRKMSIWRRYVQHVRGNTGFTFDRGAMIYPSVSVEGPEPHDDLPSEVRDLYEEARAVLPVSPRAASALVRLTLEGVLEGLYADAGDLNKMIGAAAADGLPELAVKAMDSLRFAGNKSIHEIRQDDTVETATVLFEILNLVVERLIAAPKQVTALHDLMPKGMKEAIAKRDAPGE